MAGGWIKLHRSLMSHWLWAEKPFDRKAAWIDLLLCVNHAEGKIFFGGEVVGVAVGETVTSEAKLAERWGWSRSKVRGFLQRLEAEGMLHLERGKKRTAIKLINYGFYQNTETEPDPRKDRTKTDAEPMKDTNKKEKKKETDNTEKKERKERGFLPPTLTEVFAYCEEQGYVLDGERFIDYYQSKGWMIGSAKMQDWKAALRNWAKQERRGKEERDDDGRNNKSRGSTDYGIKAL